MYLQLLAGSTEMYETWTSRNKRKLNLKQQMQMKLQVIVV